MLSYVRTYIAHNTHTHSFVPSLARSHIQKLISGRKMTIPKRTTSSKNKTKKNEKYMKKNEEREMREQSEIHAKETLVNKRANETREKKPSNKETLTPKKLTHALMIIVHLIFLDPYPTKARTHIIAIV